MKRTIDYFLVKKNAAGQAQTRHNQQSEVGAPISGAGNAGCYTKEAGFWSYYEINYLTENNFGGVFVWSMNLDVTRANTISSAIRIAFWFQDNGFLLPKLRDKLGKRSVLYIKLFLQYLFKKNF
ncbi:uncharacterized protein LOC122883118 [Siniperca chuatsi]|uniref:uncharacterized protein LOC122883118 n=1 Tax=Siniperca chuatsi TaxID=119488 RepID=UPI001CE13077|nr:uncharacterized protein LOC122883118 [Siniperca chuatsi]